MQVDADCFVDSSVEIKVLGIEQHLEFLIEEPNHANFDKLLKLLENIETLVFSSSRGRCPTQMKLLYQLDTRVRDMINYNKFDKTSADKLRMDCYPVLWSIIPTRK